VKFHLVLFIVPWLVASPLTARDAENPDARVLVRRFEQTYRSSKTLRAVFSERYLESGKQVRSESGVAYFSRPGKMRWEYLSPEPNLYVIDGKWSWFYVPADHTVTRIRAKQSSDWRTPLALLAGEMKVSRLCRQVVIDTAAIPSLSSNVVLRCELRDSAPAPPDRVRSPVSAAAGNQVLFEVNSSTGELNRVLISDPGGVQVEYRFANWKFDPPLESQLFRFEPPKGVAIVDGELATGGEALTPDKGNR
jgi:Outer membrane lipoprotein-sorting protein